MIISSQIPVAHNGGLLAGGLFGRREYPYGLLHREIDRLFDAFSGGLPLGETGALAPSMDVAETDKAYEIDVELPGLEERDVEVSLVDNRLTIRGQKQNAWSDKGKAVQVAECAYGAFQRTLELPSNVDPAGIKANMKSGVLKITAPKKESPSARRIEVRHDA